MPTDDKLEDIMMCDGLIEEVLKEAMGAAAGTKVMAARESMLMDAVTMSTELPVSLALMLDNVVWKTVNVVVKKTKKNEMTRMKKAALEPLELALIKAAAQMQMPWIFHQEMEETLSIWRAQ